MSRVSSQKWTYSASEHVHLGAYVWRQFSYARQPLFESMPLRRHRWYSTTNGVTKHDNSAVLNAQEPLHPDIMHQIPSCDQSLCQALPMLRVHIVLLIIRTRAILTVRLVKCGSHRFATHVSMSNKHTQSYRRTHNLSMIPIVGISYVFFIKFVATNLKNTWNRKRHVQFGIAVK